MDVNLDGIAVVSEQDMRLVPVDAVRQNVSPVKGKGLSVHGGKTATALRIVPLPEFVTMRLRARRRGDESPNGGSSRPLAETGSPRTGGHRPCAAASGRSGRRWGWSG